MRWEHSTSLFRTAQTPKSFRFKQASLLSASHSLLSDYFWNTPPSQRNQCWQYDCQESYFFSTKFTPFWSDLQESFAAACRAKEHLTWHWHLHGRTYWGNLAQATIQGQTLSTVFSQNRAPTLAGFSCPSCVTGEICSNSSPFSLATGVQQMTAALIYLYPINTAWIIPGTVTAKPPDGQHSNNIPTQLTMFLWDLWNEPSCFQSISADFSGTKTFPLPPAGWWEPSTGAAKSKHQFFWKAVETEQLNNAITKSQTSTTTYAKRNLF